MKKKFVLPLALLLTISLMAFGSLTLLAEERVRQDGTYTAYSDADEHGYVEAEVTIADGSIDYVQLTEVMETGFAKTDDYPYEPALEATEELPARFQEADSHEVDAYTGATGTSNKAIQAVERALKRAEGVEEPFDGVFFGASEVDDRNNRGVAWVAVQDGEIGLVSLKEYSNVHDGELKDETYQLDEWHEAGAELPWRFVEADSADVDAYTGATGSSEKWIQAVERALEKALA